MSSRLINRSPDLRKLRDEGYDIEVRGGLLLVKSVPYVTTERTIALGTLVSSLTLSGDVTATPDTHVVNFAGSTPCDKDGTPLTKIYSEAKQTLAPGLEVDFQFSSKPAESYPDYYVKMTTYANMLLGPASALDPSVPARPFNVVEATEDDGVFCYADSASSRAGIDAITAKLELAKIAIVGLGGTGSYILDFVTKTPVREIHLFDGDILFQHNAFRAPGAASLEELQEKPRKVDYLSAKYSAMRRGIVPHAYYLDAENAHELEGMDFVFLASDDGPSKKAIVEKLLDMGIPFVDTGMGIYQVEGSLAGLLRTTTSTPTKRDHVLTKGRISFAEALKDEYASNIQIADLNALNAALAVIKWKKLFGFYNDLEQEHHSIYQIDGNCLTNEEQP